MQPRIGFIGLGAMGKPMAANIAKAGFELTVCDLRKARCKELAALGARVAASPREVAEKSEIILTARSGRHGLKHRLAELGFNFTDENYRNVGVGMDKPNADLGRYTVTKNETDKGAFKTPTLRDVARRGPYMHDGSEKTLEEVVAFYNGGGVKNPWLSSDVRPLNLTAQEQKDLVAFMHSLSGEIDPEVVKPPTLPQ